MNETLILLIHCPDREGLVASVTALIRGFAGNIVDLDQHVDASRRVFFMRVEWTPRDAGPEAVGRFEETFAAQVAAPYQMHWRLERASRRPRVAVFVSRYGHCLYDILARWESAEWPIDIPLIVSNHRDLEAVAARHGIRYEHVPVTGATRPEAEQRQIGLLHEAGVDLVILARYMQIVSPAFIDAMKGNVINIHHSFLPAFAGGQPYHAAHQRGVKIIGATSHYVTADLDAGPIIAQDVATVSHKDSVEDMVRKGRDLEKIVLARAVYAHLRHEVLVFDNRTVVFD
ncbi:MAG: formyltetrahydrofolate deformylase [Lysobacterales bacterium]|jgi:formyltetrahydrofolate deformylase|nr:MAG: formyltetrahydrofolate deformylase [Xanthomonadales bacterium]